MSTISLLIRLFLPVSSFTRSWAACLGRNSALNSRLHLENPGHGEAAQFPATKEEIFNTPGKPRITTVEFAQCETGCPRIQITATKEVVLSAGAVGTPHILLHSGIGDRTALESLHIPVIVDLPDVGRNLSDHPSVVNTWLVNSTKTFDAAGRNSSLAAEEFEQWLTTQTGPLVNTVANHLGWLRLPDDSPIFEQFVDPAPGKNSPHFEFIFLNGFLPGFTPPTGNYLTIATPMVSPMARGSISLKTNNPFDAPLINPNLLGSEFDMLTMREAIRSAQRFLEAPAWEDYILTAVGGLEDTSHDEAMDAYIRLNAATVFHTVGTAAMSPRGARYGVVDPDLRVKGVDGLRVVDASVLPIVPAAHTQAPVYLVSERAATLIKAFWRF